MLQASAEALIVKSISSRGAVRDAALIIESIILVSVGDNQ
jgi:hypothetical protein